MPLVNRADLYPDAPPGTLFSDDMVNVPDAVAASLAVQKARSSLEAVRRELASRASAAYDMEQTASGQTRLSGQLMLNNPGEKLINVVFPQKYVDKPLLSFGGEIKESDSLVPGQFPTISVCIAGWTTEQNPPFQLYYTGCKLAIVTTGPPHQRMIVHWHLDGNAYSLGTEFTGGDDIVMYGEGG